MFRHIVLLLCTISFTLIKCDVVCSEDELVKEILEDLADNGIKQKLLLN